MLLLFLLIIPAIIGIIKRECGFSPFKLRCAVLLRRKCKKSWVLSNPFGWLIEESSSGVITSSMMVGSIIPFIRGQVTPLLSGTEVCLTIMDGATGHTTSPVKR